MSEESLNRLMEQLQSDETFRQAMIDDPVVAVAEFDLSLTEIEALASNDEDALRRLAGVETAAFGMPGLGMDLGGLRAMRTNSVNKCNSTSECVAQAGARPMRTNTNIPECQRA